MTKRLVRFAKRLSSWEPATSDDDLIQTEFWRKDRGGPDLRPSVYEIDPSAIVQAFAEHATAFEPPSRGFGVDLGGTNHTVEVTPGDTGFEFTMAAHREMVVKHRDDLLGLVHEVRSSLAERAHPVTKSEIVAYAQTRLAAEDEEWERAQASDEAKRWVRKLG